MPFTQKIKLIGWIVLGLLIIPGARLGYEYKKSRSFDLFFTTTETPFIKATCHTFTENFLIDTGGAFCCRLYEPLVDQLPQKTIYETSTFRDVTGELKSCTEFLMHDIKFLKLNFINFAVIPNPLEFRESHYLACNPTIGTKNQKNLSQDPVRSLIGHQLLNVMNFMLDFKKNTLILYQPELVPSLRFPFKGLAHIEQIPFEYEENRGLYCWIETNFGKKRFLIDTGASLTFLSPHEIFIQASQNTDPDCLNSLVFDHFKLGSKDFAPQEAHIVNQLNFENMDGILGMDFFDNKILFFDMTNRILYLKD